MTRREFLFASAGAALVSERNRAPVVVPVRLVVDTRSKWRPGQVAKFQSGIWAQALRDLGRGGIQLQATMGEGEVWRYAYREPEILGLACDALNFVITDALPLTWDHGRGLCGVTTRYRGRYLCMAAANRAHGNVVPFLSVNTCLHELLHALMLDIFEEPKGWWSEAREFRIDYYATRLWLLGDGQAVRSSAHTWLERSERVMQASVPACLPDRGHASPYFPVAAPSFAQPAAKPRR